MKHENLNKAEMPASWVGVIRRFSKEYYVISLFLFMMCVVCVFCARANAQDTVNVNDFKNTWAVTIQDIMEYKTKCYNDSTAHYYYIMCDMGCWDVPCDKGSKDWTGRDCPVHWKHVTPTFEGFVAWLQKKYYH